MQFLSNKLKLSKHSEDLLFQVLFTNAYPPKKNLNSEQFLKEIGNFQNDVLQ